MSNKNKIQNREEFNVDKPTKKQLLNYIKENLSKGYSLESIRKALVKYGYDKLFSNYLTMFTCFL